ncbi:MAG: mechanosensitive ion channel [Desulfobacterales bacterium]
MLARQNPPCHIADRVSAVLNRIGDIFLGLAIGFGAQTLVKDIIAGIFFLMDDSFRVGDFIETSGTKGIEESSFG